MATFLKHCLLARLNVAVIGKPHSGYQDLMSALAGVTTPPLAWLSWPEETLRPPAGLDCSRIQWAASKDSGDLLELMLHTGQRVVVPNPPLPVLRGLTQSIARGLDGVILGQEGPSIETTLLYWSQALATREVGVLDAHKLLTRTIDVGIEVARLGDGRSRVLRIAEIRQRDGAIRDIFDFVVERTASGGSIEGHFRGVGEPPALLATLRSRGVVLDESLFLRPPSE
jgi:pilus assembly protein CpaF